MIFSRRAFSLVELLVILAIVVILAAILFPVFTPRSPYHHNPRISSCQLNLKQISLGLMQYAQDYDDKLPPAATGAKRGWATEIQPYLKNWQVFQCPSEKSPPVFRGVDYWFNRRLSARDTAKIANPKTTVWLAEGHQTIDPRVSHSMVPFRWIGNPKSPLYRHVDVANYGFADGHVKWFKPEKLREIDAGNGIYSLVP